MIEPVVLNQILYEVEFSTSRSSGPGGQNVNKVNTKVTVRWNASQSQLISAEQKDWLLKKLANKLTSDGHLILSSQDKRSQLQNKADVLFKFEKILTAAFHQPKARKSSRPSGVSKKKRLDSKRKHAEKKQWRRRI